MTSLRSTGITFFDLLVLLDVFVLLLRYRVIEVVKRERNAPRFGKANKCYQIGSIPAGYGVTHATSHGQRIHHLLEIRTFKHHITKYSPFYICWVKAKAVAMRKRDNITLYFASPTEHK